MQAASREALATLRQNQVVTDSAALSVDAVIAQRRRALCGRGAADRAAAAAAGHRRPGHRPERAGRPGRDGLRRQGQRARPRAGPGRGLRALVRSPWDLVDALEPVGRRHGLRGRRAAGRPRRGRGPALPVRADPRFRGSAVDAARRPERRRRAAGRAARLDRRREGAPADEVAARPRGRQPEQAHDRHAVTPCSTWPARAESRSVARVLSAVEVTAAQQQRLAAVLSELTDARSPC